MKLPAQIEGGHLWVVGSLAHEGPEYKMLEPVGGHLVEQGHEQCLSLCGVSPAHFATKDVTCAPCKGHAYGMGAVHFHLITEEGCSECLAWATHRVLRGFDVVPFCDSHRPDVNDPACRPEIALAGAWDRDPNEYVSTGRMPSKDWRKEAEIAQRQLSDLNTLLLNTCRMLFPHDSQRMIEEGYEPVEMASRLLRKYWDLVNAFNKANDRARPSKPEEIVVQCDGDYFEY